MQRETVWETLTKSGVHCNCKRLAKYSHPLVIYCKTTVTKVVTSFMSRVMKFQLSCRMSAAGVGQYSTLNVERSTSSTCFARFERCRVDAFGLHSDAAAPWWLLSHWNLLPNKSMSGRHSLKTRKLQTSAPSRASGNYSYTKISTGAAPPPRPLHFVHSAGFLPESTEAGLAPDARNR